MIEKLVGIKRIGLFFSIPLICFFLLLSACNSDTPDVSSIKIDLKTQRLDKDLAAIDTNQIAPGLQQLKSSYPVFLDFYLDDLMGFQIKGEYYEYNEGIIHGLKTFLTHPDYRNLLDTVSVHFPNTNKIDAELIKGFQYLRHYEPAYKIPGIVYLVTGLNNYAAFTYDSNFIGIGLDMYLGKDYVHYKSVGIPSFLVKRCDPEYTAVHVFQAIYEADHTFEMDGKFLLDMMLQRGKEQYFLEKVLPFKADSLRTGFSAAELKWCEENEANVYNFFVQEKLLYETNWQKILRYINDGPKAAGMPDESPGNVGTWLGWQIIKKFASKKPSLTLQEIFSEEDPQKILRESEYKPK